MRMLSRMWGSQGVSTAAAQEEEWGGLRAVDEREIEGHYQ